MFALEDLETPTHTAMAYLVTDEEVGSGSNISVGSEWFRRVVAEVIRAEKGSVSELDVMECFGNTDMITADTTTATNPLWPSPQAPDNASLLHHGLVIKLYGAGRSANSEFVARLRRMLDDDDVAWQSHTYKAGYGGGTIARYFNQMNMEVTDWGVASSRCTAPTTSPPKPTCGRSTRGSSPSSRADASHPSPETRPEIPPLRQPPPRHERPRT